MKANMIRYFYFTLILTLHISCFRNERKLYIAAASNVQYAIKELADTFASQSNIPIELITGSSGKLTAQIMEGAPFDIFLSADMKYPEALFAANKAVKEPVVYAYGSIVLWTMRKDIAPTIELLMSDEIKHIAIPNPLNAPFGRSAMQVLRYYQLDQDLSHKLVYAESVSQTNQFIMTGAAEIGFTAKSIVFSPELKGKGRWIELKPNTYEPIKQGVIIIKNQSESRGTAELFYNFLFSENAREILTKYGYQVYI